MILVIQGEFLEVRWIIEQSSRLKHIKGSIRFERCKDTVVYRSFGHNVLHGSGHVTTTHPGIGGADYYEPTDDTGAGVSEQTHSKKPVFQPTKGTRTTGCYVSFQR